MDVLHPCGFLHTPEWQSCLDAAAYSNTGLILFRNLWDPLWSVDWLCDIPWGRTRLLAFLVMYSMWVFHLRLSCVQTPSSLNEFTLSITSLPIVSDGGSGITSLKQWLLKWLLIQIKKDGSQIQYVLRLSNSSSPFDLRGRPMLPGCSYSDFFFFFVVFR